MKDKLVSMAPFFVIMLLIVGWGFTQGWFTPAPAPETETAAADAEAPAEAAVESPKSPGPAPEAAAAEKPAERPASVAGEPPAAQWSTYHGDTQLAGVVDVELPAEPRRLWRYQANGVIYHAPVASERLIHAVTNRGEVIAVDFKGVKAWSKQLTRIFPSDGSERPARIDGPASCFDETVYVGTMAGVVYALDAATGEEKWRRDIDSTILGAVTMQPATETEAARLYVIGQDDGALHCLSADDGTPLWTSDPIDRCDGSPSSAPGVLAFGSCASALHVVSAEDGAILHNISLGADAQVAGGVAIRGNSLFSGSQSGEVFHADWSDGSLLWTNTDAGGEVFTTPAVSADRVVFGAMDDHFYSLDRATGTLQWKVAARGMTTSPVIARDKLVVAAGGVLSILALDSGEELWSFEVSDETSSPSIIGGMIVVGSDDGTVSAFGAP